MENIIPFFPKDKNRRLFKSVPPEGVSAPPAPDPYAGRDFQAEVNRYFGCGSEGPFDEIYHARAAKIATLFNIRVEAVLGWHQGRYPRERAWRSCFIAIDSLLDAEAWAKQQGSP